MGMRKISTVCVVLLAAAFVCSGAQRARAAQVTKTFTITRADLDNASATVFNLALAMGGAQVTVTQSGDTDTVLKADITYNDFGPVPSLETSSSGGLFSATLSSGFDDSDVDHGMPFAQTWNIEIGAYDVDTDLLVAGGGVDSTMDFGGMPLRSVNLALGGASANVDFSEPTSRSVNTFMVEGGGMNLDVNRLGNTDFRTFMLACGGALVNLDFSGAYGSSIHDARVICAGSIINVSAPSTVGQSLEALYVSSLAVVWGTDWQRHINLFFYKNYQSENYGSADASIDMQMLAAGSLMTVRR